LPGYRPILADRTLKIKTAARVATTNIGRIDIEFLSGKRSEKTPTGK
jgi:hypothetical protein